MMNRKIAFIILIISLFFCTGLIKAQMPNYMPVVQKQMMNMQFNNFMLRPMNFEYRKAVVQKHSFKVVFTDSTEKNITGKINSDSTMQYIRWEDKSVGRKDPDRFKKIYPSQTQFVVRADNNFPEYLGKAFDTCWLFKAITGKINAYSPVADNDLTTSFIRYIQKDDGRLVEMNPDNLQAMLKDNEKALGLFEKKKYEKAILKYNKENR